jgi:2-keto-4-pentenoate hydratase
LALATAAHAAKVEDKRMRTTLGDTARLLSSARRDVRRITLDPDQKPVDVAEAYAVQDAVGGLLVPGGAPTLGWKVGAPDARAVPSAAPIYLVLSAPARIPASSLNMIGVEAEIAYVFAAGLPRRATPYSTDEALRAVGGCCVAIEVCDSRLADWQAADDLTKLADHGLNYALVIGERVRDFRRFDLRRQPVRTLIDGKVLKEGVGCHALDDPASLLPWLVNHAAGRGGVKRGSIVTTGSWLGMHFIAPGAEVAVEFPGIGRAAVAFPAG